MLLVLEDAALNAAGPSATLAAAYLKQRLGYGGPPAAARTNEPVGQLELSFEHNILEDGT